MLILTENEFGVSGQRFRVECELETMMDIVCVRDMQQLEDAPACCLLTTHCSQQCDGVRRELETVETVKDMDINVDVCVDCGSSLFILSFLIVRQGLAAS